MMDLDNLIGGCSYVNLKFTSLVEWTIHECEQTLMCDIWSIISRIFFEFVGDIVGMLITI